jgi:hypothetical protein
MRRKNPQKVVALVGLGVALAGGFLVALPFLVGMDGMSGGFALSTGGLFVAICGTVVAVVYASRARALGRILLGKDLLAHWKVDPKTQRLAAEADYEEERKEKWTLFLVVAGITLVIGLVFLLLDREVGWIVFLVLLGVLAVIALVAWAGPRRRLRLSRRSTGDVYITPDGAYANGAFHTWTLLGARLEGARFEEGSPALLEVAYSAPVRFGRQGYVMRVPVPQGEEEAARRVVDELNRRAAPTSG